MANRSRSRAAAATGQEPAAKPATRRAAAAKTAPAPAQGTGDDEQKLDQDDDDDDAEATPGISLSAEDFRNNPRVKDMAAEVDGEPGDDFSGNSTRADDDDDDEPAAPAKRSSRGGRVRVRLVGLRDAKGRVSKRARPPYGVTLVVPAEDVEDQDAGYGGLHTEGETVQFTRGRSVSVSRRAAEWLASHPTYAIEEA